MPGAVSRTCWLCRDVADRIASSKTICGKWLDYQFSCKLNSVPADVDVEESGDGLVVVSRDGHKLQVRPGSWTSPTGILCFRALPTPAGTQSEAALRGGRAG